MEAGLTRPTFHPDYVVAPGVTLRETLLKLGMSQAEFAKRADLSTKHVNQIIQGEAPITPDTAVALELVTSVPARTWNGLEANYQAMSRFLQSRKSLDVDDKEWLTEVPIKELVRRGVFSDTKDPGARFEQVLRLFGVANRRAWEALWLDPEASFHRSAAYQIKPAATATWLRLAELEASDVACLPFDRALFREAAFEVRGWSRRPITRGLIDKIRERFSAAGVAFVLVEEIEGSRASGATRWMSPTKAFIALSLRYKRDDRFWFTLFHEVAHVLLHGKRQTFIDLERGKKKETIEGVAEAEADRLAADMLIPKAHLPRLRTLQTPVQIEAFAREAGVPAGVVVGRMQNAQIIPWSAFNELRQPIDLPTLLGAGHERVEAR